MLTVMWPGTEPVGLGGLRDRGLLESAVHRPFQSAFGTDIFPSIEEKAAALFHSLISNHPFIDGNKRTAVTSVCIFLVANFLVCLLTNEEMYKLATRAASYRGRGASHDEAFAEILDALRGNIVPLE